MECLKRDGVCIGREGRAEYREPIGKCCKEEIEEDKEIVQSVIDSIDDYTKDSLILRKIASRLSFATTVVNHNNKEDLLEIFSLLKRYSVLVYEYVENILDNEHINSLVYFFNNELKEWLQIRFLQHNSSSEKDTLLQSIIANMETIEMSLGVCMVQYDNDDSLDDIFF